MHTIILKSTEDATCTISFKSESAVHVCALVNDFFNGLTGQEGEELLSDPTQIETYCKEFFAELFIGEYRPGV